MVAKGDFVDNQPGRTRGDRWRLRVKRQWCDKNGVATRGDTTTSQGKQEGSTKASVT